MSSTKITSDIILSLATAPLLGLLLGGKALAQLVQEVGLASEELFRGDRLPILPRARLTPDTPDTSNESAS